MVNYSLAQKWHNISLVKTLKGTCEENRMTRKESVSYKKCFVIWKTYTFGLASGFGFDVMCSVNSPLSIPL